MDELKRTLQSKADEMRIGPAMPTALRTRSRRRRLGNAAVAVTVVGAVGFGSFTGFRFALEKSAGPRPVIPADQGDRGIPSLFPKPRLVPELQRHADSGTDREWLDPRFVATQFAADAMGWGPQETRFRVETGAPVRVTVWNPMLTVVGSDHVETILYMQRYQGREDGIYMVTMAQSPAIEIDTPRPWDPVRPQQQVGVQGRLGSNHEGGALLTEISTFAEDVHSFRNIGYQPQFSFDMRTPDDRAFAISFTAYDAEGTDIATTAFRLQGLGPVHADERVAPSPGPTPTSDDATPPPVRIVLEDRTGVNNAFPYAFSWVESLGRGIHHGGYDMGQAYNSGYKGDGSSVAPTLKANPIPVTTIYCEPAYNEEASRMERLLFPGAQISNEPPVEDVIVDDPDPQPLLRIVLGMDFAERHAETMRAFEFVADFGLARAAGSSRAEDFVTDEVANEYREDGTLSMYDYAQGRQFEERVTEAGGVPTDGDPGLEFYLVFYESESDFNSERLRVDEIEGELKIVEAALEVSGSS